MPLAVRVRRAPDPRRRRSVLTSGRVRRADVDASAAGFQLKAMRAWHARVRRPKLRCMLSRNAREMRELPRHGRARATSVRDRSANWVSAPSLCTMSACRVRVLQRDMFGVHGIERGAARVRWAEICCRKPSASQPFDRKQHHVTVKLPFEFICQVDAGQPR